MLQRLGLLPRKNTPARRDAPVTLGYHVAGDGSVRAVNAPMAGKSDGLELPNYARAIGGLGGVDVNGLAQAYVASVWAFRCIALKANAIARMPWRVVDAHTRKEIADHPLALALRRNPRLFRKWPWSLDIWGEAFIEKVRNAYRYPKDLKWLNPMGIDVDTSTGKIRSVQYMPPGGGQYVTFEPDDIVFARTDNPFDDLRGLSPFLAVMDEIGIDRDLSRMTRAFYANDARPGMMLVPKSNVGIPDAQRFIEWWKKEYQGAKNAGKPVFMPYEIDLKEVQRPPSADDVTLRESLRREIAAAFGVPLSLAGAWDEAQYQSLPEQRQSFYEETVLPLCMDIGDDVNSYAMPFFDGSARAEFEWVFDDILALSAASKLRSEALAKDLASGGITVNQYRQEKGYEPIPTGNVLYVPAGVVVTKIEDLGKAQPPPAPAQPFPLGLPQRTQAPQIPAQVSTPTPPAERPALPTPAANAPQATPGDELAAWERKALSKGAAKALGFRCDVLDDALADTVRVGLAKAADKAAVRRVFADAKATLKQDIPADVTAAVATPEEPLDYWRRYDELLAQLGDAWLSEYMARAYAALPTDPNALDEPGVIEAALDALHDDLAAAWVGTDDAPGALTQLALAGMAAGNEVLLHDAQGAPDSAARKADVLQAALGVDWNLLPKEAIEFARRYFYDLIRGIDQTTVEQVRAAVAGWLETGGTDADLRAALESIFHDPRRAALIAQTESSRAYTQGALERYKRAEVKEVEFYTTRDSLVCPVCGPLHKTRAPIDVGFAGIGFPPLHPGCRCYTRGVI